MKRNSLVFLFLLINLTSFSQKIENGQNELKEIFLSLPDSVFSDNIFDLSKEESKLFWDQYLKEKYENVEMSNDRIYGITNLMFRSDSLSVDAFIDFSGKILRIMNRNTDAIPTCDVKIYNYCCKKIIGVTIKSSDHATTHTDVIAFYKYKRGKYKNVTDYVLEGFNYFTDNYSKATIDSLNKFYSCNLRVEPKNRKLLYRFTESDTVFITYDFFDYYYFNDELLDLHQEKHDEENHMKKYIMKKGKLKLAE